MSRVVCRRGVLAALALAAALVALAHPPAVASDVWANVGPATGLAGLDGRYPLGNYALDKHFTAVSAGVFSGIDVSGVPPMIAYFLAEVLWQLTAFLANTLISLFSFAFGLDLLNGSAATGGAGALGPVAAAIHSIYANAFGQPWLVLAVAVVGIWAMWRALVLRRYSETASALGLSLIYVVCALFFVAQPAKTIGAASHWTNQMSAAFLAISEHGSPSGTGAARQDGADQLFSLLAYEPWTVLEFGGVEHCVRAGTGSGGSDPVSAPVRPLSADPGRDATLSRRLAAGEEVAAEGKTCINDQRKYAPHFLRFAPGSDERNAEYEALSKGDASKLPEADPARASYKLGPADKPAAEAMEAGGQYQRLLVAIVVFVGELGAFCLLGALSVGVILAQVLLLLLLAFAPVALVAAAIPGRGHDFFKGWLAKLAGYLLRKAAYSLILAVLLAVCAALSSATSELGWLMSFGLQALFLWAVFLQRKTLTESLIGIATGPSAPGREGALRVLALYYGARTLSRPLRSGARSARSAARGAGRRAGGGATSGPARGSGSAPRLGVRHGQAVGDAGQAAGGTASARGGDSRPSAPRAARGEGRERSSPASAQREGASVDPGRPAEPKGAREKRPADRQPGRPQEEQPRGPRPKSRPPSGPAPSRQSGASGESPLHSELRSDRERADAEPSQARAERRAEKPPPDAQPSRKPRRRGSRGGKR